MKILHRHFICWIIFCFIFILFFVLTMHPLMILTCYHWLETLSSNCFWRFRKLYPFQTTRIISNSEEYAPLTLWTQGFIHKHQNPLDCSSVKFLYTESKGGSGFASQMHVMGTHLAFAIEHGYVLMWGKKSCIKYSSPCDTIFKPLSNCTASQAKSVDHIHGDGYRFLIPKVLRDKLKPFNMSCNRLLYWWRGQSIAFLMKMRPEVEAKLTMFSLPSQTVHLHLRYGDKYIESPLVPINTFLNAYWMLLDKHNVSKNSVFISSDTSVSVEIIRNRILAVNPSCLVQFIPRYQIGFHYDHLTDSNNENKTIDFLSEIFTALKASAWIGTRFSNVDRMIDELRCTIVPKCNLPYVNIGSTQEDEFDW